MTLRKRVEAYLRGWLPKAPKQPERTSETSMPNRNLTNSNFRIGGTLLSSIGVLLISLCSYQFVLWIAHPPIQNIDLPIRIGFVAGIVLSLLGTTLRAHSIESNVQPFKRTQLIVGLTLLTISVFGFTFNSLIGLNYVNFTLPTYGNMWISTIAFPFIAVVGWLSLLNGKLSEALNFPKKSFSILAFGAISSLIAALFQLFLILYGLFHESVKPAGTVLFLDVSVLSCLILGPLGTICITYGWAAMSSVSLKRMRKLTTRAD